MKYFTELGAEFHASRIVDRVKFFLDLDFIKSIEAKPIPHPLDYKVYVKIVIDESKYLMNLLQENTMNLDAIKDFINDIEDERYIFDITFEFVIE